MSSCHKKSALFKNFKQKLKRRLCSEDDRKEKLETEDTDSYLNSVLQERDEIPSERRKSIELNACKRMLTLEELHQLSDRQLRNLAAGRPDQILWQDVPITVTLKKASSQTFGMQFKQRYHPKRKSLLYVMVHRVIEGTPAEGKVHVGDLIISYNNEAIQTDEEVEKFTEYLKNAHPFKEIKLIIQRPKRYKCPPNCRICRPLIGSPYTRLETTRSRFTRDPLENLFRMRCEDMQRLPDMRLLFLGDSNEAVAKFLFGTNIFHGNQTNEHFMKGALSISRSERKNESDLKCVITDKDLRDWMISESNALSFVTCLKSNNLNETEAVQAPNTVSDTKTNTPRTNEKVYLSVIAPLNSQNATAFEHVLMTPFSIFVLTAKYHKLSQSLQTRDQVLRELTDRLRKIKLYSGKNARIILMVTSGTDIASEERARVAALLKEQTLCNFQRQLEFEDEYPCHFVNLSSSFNDLDRPDSRVSEGSWSMPPSSPMTSLESMSIGDTLLSMSSSVSSHSRSRQPSNCSNESKCEMNVQYTNCFDEMINNLHFGKDDSQAQMALQRAAKTNSELKSRILNLAYNQTFVPRKYPLKFVFHRSKIWNLKRQGRVCEFYDNIKKECEVNDNELEKFLGYLHSTGDVISFGFSKMASILLHPESLIDPILHLSSIPSKEKQQPDLRHHWDVLEQTNLASEVLLKHIAGAAKVEFLEKANIIHRLGNNSWCIMEQAQNLHLSEQQNILQSNKLYLLPPIARSMNHVPVHSGHSVCLYVQFPDWLPHGTFAMFVVQLLECGKHWNLQCHMTEALRCEVSLKCYGTVIIDEDVKNHCFRISARLREDYSRWNLLRLVEDVMTELQVSLPEKMVPVIGVECPLHSKDSIGSLHIIPLSSKHCSHQLICGNRKVPNDPHMCQWHPGPDEKVISTLQTKECLTVERDTLLTDLPVNVYDIICTKLSHNCPVGTRDWRGIAGYLNKTASEVEDLITICKHSQRRPCDQMFQEWCQQSGDGSKATIGRLIEILNDLKRIDVIRTIEKVCVLVD